MYCINCGKEIPDGNKNCNFCGKEVITNNQIHISDEDNKKANKLCIISLILTFVLPIISLSVTPAVPTGFSRVLSLLNVGPIVGFVLMIIARVKYPKNTFAKVLMWLYIIYVVVSVLLLIIVFNYIIESCRGCSQMGTIFLGR